MKFKDSEWYKLFGDCEYRVTFPDGRIIESEGFNRANAKVEFDKRELKSFSQQIKRTRF